MAVVRKGRPAPAPELPVEGAYVWAAYRELDLARTSNGYGPNPISYTDMLAYFVLQGMKPRPWVIATLRAIDVAFLTFVSERSEQKAHK